MENNTWTCHRCDTINWDSQDKCQICGEKKIYNNVDSSEYANLSMTDQAPLICNETIRTIKVPLYFKAVYNDNAQRKTILINEFVISENEVNCYDSVGKNVLSFSINKNDSIDYIAKSFIISANKNIYKICIESVQTNAEAAYYDDFAKDLLSGFYGYITIKNEDLFKNTSISNTTGSKNSSNPEVGIGIFLFFVQFILFMFSINSVNIKSTVVGYVDAFNVPDIVTTVTASPITPLFIIIMIICLIGEISLIAYSSSKRENNVGVFIIFAALNLLGWLYILIGVTHW